MGASEGRLFRSGEQFVVHDVPDQTADRARAFLEAGASGFQPSVPRLSSSVLLMRERWGQEKTEWSIELDPALEAVRERAAEMRAAGTLLPHPLAVPDNGVEIFMIRRQRSMPTSPNAVVFPGGGADARDAEADLPWDGPAPSEWAALLGVSEETARRAVVAAVREVYEETGVLLAGSPDGAIASDLSGTAWAEHRAALSGHQESFAEFLRAVGLRLRSDLLGAKARWMTPPYEARRYDTFFFAAAVPAGQEPDGECSESFISDWVQPRWAFVRGDDGTINLLPPTKYNLEQAMCAASLADALRSVDAPVHRMMLEPFAREDGSIALRTLVP